MDTVDCTGALAALRRGPGVDQVDPSSRLVGVELQTFNPRCIERAEMGTGMRHLRRPPEPTWLKEMQEQLYEVTGLSTQVDHFKGLTRKRLLRVFEDAETAALQRQLDSAAKGITSDIIKVEGCLKTFRRNLLESPEGLSDLLERTLAENVMKRLGADVFAVSRNFQAAQTEFVARLRERQVRAGAATATDERRALLDDSVDFQADTTLTVGSRHDQTHGVDNLVKSLETLHEMFCHLGEVVVDQGTMLDRIDVNVSGVESNMDQGLVELRKSEERAKSGLARRIIAALAVWNVASLVTITVKIFMKFS